MIYIDGDACNVISKTETLAKQFNIPCHIYCDTHRMLESKYSEIHIVDHGRDSADFAIVNKCGENDIVITHDSGLAAMVLAKHAIAINPRGFEYTQQNILQLLTSRHVRNHEMRKTNRNQVKTMRNNTKHNSYITTLKNAICRIERTTKNNEKDILS